MFEVNWTIRMSTCVAKTMKPVGEITQNSNSVPRQTLLISTVSIKCEELNRKAPKTHSFVSADIQSQNVISIPSKLAGFRVLIKNLKNVITREPSDSGVIRSLLSRL